jgi:putative ABC transport system ATP-binding protein
MIVARALAKSFAVRAGSSGSVVALKGVDLDVRAGESVALMGASGSGKSTLLHLLGALDTPTSGTLRVDGHDLAALDDRALSRFRGERVGFVFQFFHLLPTLTVAENVTLQARLAGLSEPELRSRSQALLERVGLQDRAHENPDVLSGGQRQRVALARALMMRPALLLADEPTGNLDSATSADVLALIRELVREHRMTLVMATHAPEAAAIADRVVRLKDGRPAGEIPSPSGPAV